MITIGKIKELIFMRNKNSLRGLSGENLKHVVELTEYSNVPEYKKYILSTK
jgi:hypothetical protein